MKATHHHRNMYGSHYLCCNILDSRPWTEDYMTSIEKDFGKRTVTEKQYLISYFDSFQGGLVKKWVNEEYVKLENV